MTVETDFSPEAIARRANAREQAAAANRLREQATHKETRARRLPLGSNGRRKLEAQAAAHRANATLIDLDLETEARRR